MHTSIQEVNDMPYHVIALLLPLHRQVYWTGVAYSSGLCEAKRYRTIPEAESDIWNVVGTDAQVCTVGPKP